MSLPSKSRSGDATYPRVGLTVGGGEGGTKSLGNLLVIVRSRVKILSATLPGLSSDEFLPRRSKSPASRVEGCGAGFAVAAGDGGVGGVATGAIALRDLVQILWLTLPADFPAELSAD